MRILLAPLLLAVSLPAFAEVDSKIHKLCIEAKDYAGCVRINLEKLKVNQLTRRSTDDVEVSNGFTYRESTIKQLKVRGNYGRYLTFWGRSANSYRGTSSTYLPGNPGSVNCNYNEFGLNSFDANSPLLEYGSGSLLRGSSTTNSYGNVNCYKSGYVAPTYIPGTPGGVQRGWFEYELDCRDGTYNRKGDISQGIYKKGWQDIYYDPTAKAVAARYCRKITSLPLKIDNKISASKNKKRRENHQLIVMEPTGEGLDVVIGIKSAES